MAGGESSIGQAVARLGRSLDLSEEATLHATAGVVATEAMFVRYRQALGDEVLPAGADISGMAEQATVTMKQAIASLEIARQAIRDFVMIVAPTLQLTDSATVRLSPLHEELLDTSARPRSLRSAANRAAAAAPDVSDLINQGIDTYSKFTLSPPTPPEVSGTATSVPHYQPAEAPPAGTSSHDAVTTIVLSAAVAVKAGAVAVDRTVIAFRKFLARN